MDKKIFIPRRVYLTQWYPYGVPFESLSLLYPPRWTFLGFNLLAVSAHFWPPRFFIPRRVYLTQWYPYGVPFESLSLLYPPRWTFLGFNLQAVSAHFWPPRFFILRSAFYIPTPHKYTPWLRNRWVIIFTAHPPPSFGTNHQYYTSILKTFILSKYLDIFNSFAFYCMYVAFFYFRPKWILPYYIIFFRDFWIKSKVFIFSQ